MDKIIKEGKIGDVLNYLTNWTSAVKAMRRSGVREKSDKRILDRGEFIEALSKQSDQRRKEQFFLHKCLKRAVSYIQKICKDEKMSTEALKSGSRRQRVSMVRYQLAKQLVKK